MVYPQVFLIHIEMILVKEPLLWQGVTDIRVY
jgi:hypothetical protein